MKNKRIIPFLYLSIIFSIVFGRLYFSLTDSFTIGNITSSDVPFNSSWEVPPLSPEEQENVIKILQQPFYYLTKGCQVYVLVSEDQKYVVKFFKFKHLNKKFIEYLPGIGLLKEYQDQSLRRRKAKLELLFNGYQRSFSHLRQETGLEFVHLNKTDSLHTTMTIFDKLGFSHQLDLDGIEFVVQRRAMPVYPKIQELMAQGHTERVYAILDQIVDLFLSRSNKGVNDHDFALNQNIGLLDDRVIFLDPGQFIVDEAIKHPEVYSYEIRKHLQELGEWLKGHYPELLSHFDAILYSFNEKNKN